MKILIDLTSLADNFSGIERYAACLSLEMLENRNNDYVLLFKREIHHMFKSCSYDNVKMVIVPECNKLLFNQIRLPLEIGKYKSDCYLFLAFPVPILMFRKNMISTMHDICCWDCPETMNGLSNWYFKISHRFAMLKCKRIITISEYSKRRIEDRLLYSDNKLMIIYCGVDKKFIEYTHKKCDFERVKNKYGLPSRYFLSLSTLEPRKNIGLLIDAYSELVIKEKVDIPLVLAGRKGWKMDQVLKNIPDIVRERIIITGFIDDDDLPSVYGNSDVFIFPSMYEGFGMPPLEAMACGTNVISSDSSSLPEVLGDKAYYFRNNDKESLLNALKNYIKMDNHFSEEVLKKQASLFNWNIESKKLLDSLSTIINK